MTCGIYKITNLINGKVYIGQSKRIEERWKEHKKRPFLEDSEEYNYPLYQAIRKYGLENFTFEILEECPQEELNQKEIDYIALYESYPPDNGKGYNQTPGGSQSTYFKLNENQKLAILNLLKNTSIPINDIAIIYNVSTQSIYDINNGISYVNNGYEYPIRRRIKQKFYCTICGKEINSNKDRICRACFIGEGVKWDSPIRSHSIKIQIPSKKDLLKALYELKKDYLVAEKYNISTMLLKKWKFELEIPRNREETNLLYEREYLGIVREEKIKRAYIKSKVAQISLETNEILNIFDNCNQAAKHLGFEKNEKDSTYKGAWLIRECCLGKVKNAHNYFWKFYEEDKL